MENIDYNNTGWHNLNFKNISLVFDYNKSNRIIGFAELGNGYFNKVFLVNTVKGRFVVKVSPLWNKGGLARERWIYNLLQNSHNIKKPKIISYSSEKNKLFPGHEILVLEHISGRPLNEDDFKEKSVHEKISNFLYEVHKISMDGYGWLNNNYNGSHRTWRDFLINIDNLEIVKKTKLLNNKDIQRLLDDLAKVNLEFRPKLVYGDLKKENLILNGENLYIVDFQNCFAGHYLYDLGIGIFFIPEILENITVYVESKLSQQEKRLLFIYGMRHSLSALGHRIMTNNRKEVLQAREGFRLLKEQLKKL